MHRLNMNEASFLCHLFSFIIINDRICRRSAQVTCSLRRRLVWNLLPDFQPVLCIVDVIPCLITQIDWPYCIFIDTFVKYNVNCWRMWNFLGGVYATIRQAFNGGGSGGPEPRPDQVSLLVKLNKPE